MTAGLLAASLAGCGDKPVSGGTQADDTVTGLHRKEEQTALTELTHFNLGQVEQTDDYCTNALQLEVDYLTSFDADRLLAGFRETAGLDMKGKKRYDGWENTLIGGHTMGHYLSACAQAYANAGTSEDDKKQLYSMLTEIIDGLLECQENSKGQPGFLFGATIPDKSNVELQFDNVEKGRANIITEAWVPWYTMHKIIAGVIDVYKLTGYENALTLAKGLGDWTYERTSKWDSATHNRVLSIEYGGMNDCLYELFSITGDTRHLEAAHQFDQTDLFEKVNLGGLNVLNNQHANTTIPKFLGALNRYITTDGKEIDGKTYKSTMYLDYAKSFWEMVVDRHTYITGGNSEWEHFGLDNVLDAERTNCNNETCNVYNMLKLSRSLYEITGEKKYMDYYENAFYNAILSSQNPQTGMTMYFQPMATGYFKVYGEQFNKFWCCTGSGMENFTKLNDSIYFYKDNTIVVNLYFDSKLTWEEKNVILTQNSDIPQKDTVSFTVNAIDGKQADIDLRFRVPDWAANDMTVKLNGSAYDAQLVDGYVCINGAFADGDVIELTIPIEVRACALADNETAIGFKYGPLVLSADLGTEDKQVTTTGMWVSIPKNKIVDDEIIVLPDGVTRDELLANPGKYMTRNGDDLSFTLTGCDYSFGPHYLRYQERYGIYWYILSAEEKAEKDAGAIRTEETVIDTVQPGYGQYENDNLHQMSETDTVSVTNDGTCRYANPGGSFTYRMAVNPDGNNYLVMTFSAADNGKTILVKSGDTVLLSATLDYSGTEDLYEVRRRIPDTVAAQAEAVSADGENYRVIPITFSGIDGAESARVCEFIYTKDVAVRYPVDEKLAYFVNCGDHDVTTVTGSDKFGVCNSVTEQLYGYDPVTGQKWGLIDDPTDRYNGSAISAAIYTANTWAYEFDTQDLLPKEESSRYTKNQYENGIEERYLDYAFELPDGSYEVEIGFTNPWNCSNNHNIYANYDKSNRQTLAENYDVAGSPLKANVSVTDGELTLNFRNATSAGLAINVSYILIRYAD